MKKQPPKTDIADRLRYWRKDVLSLTQEQFAETTGIHLSAVRKYENRNSKPSEESLLAIARTGVNLHWLLTGDGEAQVSSVSEDSPQWGSDPELVRRLTKIAGLLNDIQDEKRSTVLDEIFYRVQEAKRVADLEDLVKVLKRKCR